MQFISNLKIGVRLIAGFSLVVLLTAVVGSWASSTWARSTTSPTRCTAARWPPWKP